MSTLSLSAPRPTCPSDLIPDQRKAKKKARIKEIKEGLDRISKGLNRLGKHYEEYCESCEKYDIANDAYLASLRSQQPAQDRKRAS